jgi:hypothetical protein
MLNSSDESCDHGDESVEKHFFREITTSDAKVMQVEATHSWRWYALAEAVSHEWIKYAWIGRRETVDTLLSGNTYESIEDLPKRGTALDAPNDVKETVNIE